MTDELTQSERESLVSAAHETSEQILEAIGTKVVGQYTLRRRLLTALFTGGHILLEGVPGLAKTRAITTLANVLSGTFQRIQFTPDLLPADLIGTEIYRPQLGDFHVRKGPVFANFVLADEINRAPAKVQSALLETMQERQVTIGQDSFPLPSPFLVLATQNPIEQEGTYTLPEAQVDRFMLKVHVSYPQPDEELEMLNLVTDPRRETAAAVSERFPLSVVEDCQRAAEAVYVDERIRKYIVDIVGATRTAASLDPQLGAYIELGASPRGALALFYAARIEALLSGQAYVTPQEVKEVALDCLRHRILPSYEAEAEGHSADDIVSLLLERVRVP